MKLIETLTMVHPEHDPELKTNEAIYYFGSIRRIWRNINGDD